MDGEKRFDKEKIVDFCKEKGIALFDTARSVRRLKDNADDNFLEFVERTDVFELLSHIPMCRSIVTTGGKASEQLQSCLECNGLIVNAPKIGESILFSKDNQVYSWWRMPSSSRAFPMKLEKKADYYKRLWV